MNTIKYYKNNRGQVASTDGDRWWMGLEADEPAIALNALQPVTELVRGIPSSSRNAGGIGRPAYSLDTVKKARSVFVSCLRHASPTVSPSDETEKNVLRRAWDDAVKFAAAHDIVGIGVPEFDRSLMLVGSADAVVHAENGTAYRYCYAPEGWEWHGEMNAIMHMLADGFPVPCEDEPHGIYTLRELARATTLLVMRNDTPWSVESRARRPF